MAMIFREMFFWLLIRVRSLVVWYLGFRIKRLWRWWFGVVVYG
jgi:hypothetical protein